MVVAETHPACPCQAAGVRVHLPPYAGDPGARAGSIQRLFSYTQSHIEASFTSQASQSPP